MFDLGVEHNHNFFADDVLVHNCHTGSAEVYSKVLSKVDAPYRLGLTATADRKDGRHELTNFTIGPVVAKSQSVTLKPRIEVYPVKTSPPYQYRSWNGGLRFIAENPGRNKELLQAIFADLRDGHKTVIVPVAYKAHVAWLVEKINAAAKHFRVKKKEKWPLDLAVPFHSTANRQYALDRADSGEPCVLVAITSMIKQGIDLKQPTSLHAVIPMSATAAVGAPMFKQMAFRVATPMAGKRQPKVTIWVDGLSMFQGAIRGLWWNEIIPGVKSGDYVIEPRTYEIMRAVLDNRGSYSATRSKSGGTPRARAQMQPGRGWAN